jgi:hypothetical protein
MDWSLIISMQRAKVTNLFDRLGERSMRSYNALKAEWEQERACLRAMGTLLIAGDY